MPVVDVVKKTKVSRSMRSRAMEAMFDVPPSPEQTLKWHASLPYEDKPWNVGLIVGPSGSGKTTIATKLFGALHTPMSWGKGSVIDAFDAALSIETIASTCQAVGFNTIPAWLRPFEVLSNGEQFRVSIARLLLESTRDPIVCDEFTSVVDRQVAKIGSHAIQKYVRKSKKRFVAVTCHYDVEDWLQPDWVYDVALGEFRWRSLRCRPQIDIAIGVTPYDTWKLFAPFHYLTADLNKSARCYLLTANGEPASFAGVLHRPHSKVPNIKGVSRLVTLPDYQGLGLAFVLVDALGATYKRNGYFLHMYPAHPALIHQFDRSPKWELRKKPMYMNTSRTRATLELGLDSRPCAVFRYIGESWADVAQAKSLFNAKLD